VLRAGCGSLSSLAPAGRGVAGCRADRPCSL